MEAADAVLCQFKPMMRALSEAHGTVRTALPWEMTKITLEDGSCFVHVTPHADRFEHHLDFWCLCDPRVERMEEDGEFLGIMWSHQSWDRREEWEKLAKQPLH